MATPSVRTIRASSQSRVTTERLFFLDASGGRLVSANPDGSGAATILAGLGPVPDGIVIDEQAGHIYWTNMGNPKKNDGSIERCDLDGTNRTTIIPEGGTFTPKQCQLDRKNRKLYWCDREGMRVMRANLDGSHIETLVDTSQGDPRPGPDAMRWCVGIAVDADRKQVYWTQKGGDNAGVGRIFRAGLDVPKGEGPTTRGDIELLFDSLPEPIDLEIDDSNRMLYWTDRGDPPRGNSVSRAPIDFDARKRPKPEILITNLMEGIGLALDRKGRRMFFTDLAGDVYAAGLDGTERRIVLAVQGNLTGIAYAEMPGGGGTQHR